MDERGKEREKRDIQPTPVKSRRSMTSACCEDFLALGLAMGSSDWVRFEEGRGLEDGEDGEEERREALTVARPWWCTDPDDYISIPCSLARTSLSGFALGSTSSSSTTSSSAFQFLGCRLTQAALSPSSTLSAVMQPMRVGSHLGL